LINKDLNISVKDTGMGIKDDDQLKLFRAFGKLDLGDEMVINSSGVGLGLAISNEMVKLLGPKDCGGIQLQSTYGEGSSFSFTLMNQRNVKVTHNIEKKNPFPVEFGLYVADEHINQENGPAIRLTDSSPKINSGIPLAKRLFPILRDVNSPKCKCPSILVVDDDSFNLMALESILRLAKFTCECCYNGYDAIDKLLERQINKCCPDCKQYQLILMDCSMPVIDGFDTTRKVRIEIANGKIDKLAIIGCTAYSNQNIMQQCNEAGMEDVLLKPIERARLNEILKRIFGY
jgi:CheY-like chemotaxis protein